MNINIDYDTARARADCATSRLAHIVTLFALGCAALVLYNWW